MPPYRRCILLLSCLLISSCAWLMPPPQLRGNKVDPEQLKELVAKMRQLAPVVDRSIAPAVEKVHA